MSPENAPANVLPSGAAPQRLRRLTLLAAASVALVVVYVVLLVPVLFALLVLSRPASSLDDPPGLLGTMLVLLVSVAAAGGFLLRRHRAARAIDTALVALLAASCFTALAALRATLSGAPLALQPLMEAYGALLGVLAPALLLGGWLGARVLRRRALG